jgi:hypothetical protein
MICILNILFNHSVSEATPNSKTTGAYSASCSPSGYGRQECVRQQGKLFCSPQQQAGARHGDSGSHCLSPGAGRRGHPGGSSTSWGRRQTAWCRQQPARWRLPALVKEDQPQWQQWQWLAAGDTQCLTHGDGQNGVRPLLQPFLLRCQAKQCDALCNWSGN